MAKNTRKTSEIRSIKVSVRVESPPYLREHTKMVRVFLHPHRPVSLARPYELRQAGMKELDSKHSQCEFVLEVPKYVASYFHASAFIENPHVAQNNRGEAKTGFFGCQTLEIPAGYKKVTLDLNINTFSAHQIHASI